VTDQRPAKNAFGRYIVTLPVSQIIAQTEPTAAMKNTACFKQIASSLEHIGLIEPLVVFEQSQGQFLLVDGHTRLAILKARGVDQVACILARDDEGYTYNRRVSHVSPITQHFMLLRVLENGVSEERIAAALNVDIRSVRQKRDMLKGICPEAVALLEGRRLGVRAFSALRKMKPLRQIESAEHMVASNNFTLPFLRAILLVTKPDMLTSKDSKGTNDAGIAVEHSQLEREHGDLVRDLKTVEKSFGVDMLTLAVSLKYLERIMRNSKVKRYLERSCPETFLVLAGLLREPHSGDPGIA
jgi:RepB plasmid partitioning protein/ParB-like nuclease domain